MVQLSAQALSGLPPTQPTPSAIATPAPVAAQRTDPRAAYSHSQQKVDPRANRYSQQKSSQSDPARNAYSQSYHNALNFPGWRHTHQ